MAADRPAPAPGRVRHGFRKLARLAVAIEDAGFIIHPTIFLWAQSQGFPKATRIDNQVDRLLGKEDERKVIAQKRVKGGGTEHINRSNLDHDYRPNDYQKGENVLDIVEPATDLAKAWEGHRYGAQALKPVCEPIILFQKPYEGKPKAAKNVYEGGYEGNRISSSSKGRWPTNLILQHHPECRISGESEDSYHINRFTDGAKPFGNGAGHEFESD
jgi:hypothetical protein